MLTVADLPTSIAEFRFGMALRSNVSLEWRGHKIAARRFLAILAVVALEGPRNYLDDAHRFPRFPFDCAGGSSAIR